MIKAWMNAERSTITTRQRDAWLTMDDGALLAECHIDTYRASGPGGQKRNKTSSAVRLRHKPTGLMAISEESRSQHSNKRNALRRLRMTIAVDLRPVDSSVVVSDADFRAYVTSDRRLRIADSNPEFPSALARILDHIALHGGSVNEIAHVIGVTASQVIRLLAQEDSAFAQVNRIREKHGKPPLRRA